MSERPRPHSLGLAGPLGPLLYGAGRILCSTAFSLLWRRRVIGEENIPVEGGVILAANHASFADPPVVGSAIHRHTYFMAKQELFDLPVFGWLFKQLNAFPIRRVERDMGAFRMAQRILSSGECLILFPEGTRQKGGVLGRARPGVGMLALKTGCLVVPVYVHNSRNVARLGKIAVVFGEPLSPAGETDYQAFSDKVMAAVARLKEAYDGTA